MAGLTPGQARTLIDSELAPLWTAIQAAQTTYAASHGGRFFQGKRLLSATPADGVDTPPDQATSHPHYQSETWVDFLGVSLPANLAASVWVDQYNGPLGRGYTATAEGTLGGNTWQRVVQSGPETWRAAPWTQVS